MYGMEAKAISKWVRVSPDKARLLIDRIRGKPVEEALRIARFAKAKAAKPIRKTLESAIANAEHNYDMNVDELFIKEARVDRGPSLRRVSYRARGRVDIIKRRTSHITITVSDGKE